MRIRAVMLVIIVLMLGDLVFRGVVPSFTTGKNDFTDPFVASWLWRHGSNPYDVAQATVAGKALTESPMRVVPIYPPTTYMLVAPLTLLSWQWANLALALLETLAVCVMSLCVVAISRHDLGDNEAWVIVALVLAFASFHTAVHVANISVISTVLCALAVYLASRDSDLRAGILLGVATCLKPHLGVWLFAFYLLRRKWRLVAAGSLSGMFLLATALARIGLPAHALLANYSANLHHWFRPGGENDFSLANPLRFELANLQVVFDPALGRPGANAVAYAVAGLGFGLWVYAVHRNPRCSDSLALSSLLALSFLPVYHRVYDTGILTLALAWMFDTRLRNLDHRQKIVKGIAAGLFLLLLLPIQSVAVRAQSYLSPQAIHSWWWNFVLAPYTSWTLLAFSAVLLYALFVSLGPSDLAPTPALKAATKS
jgi:Glycosyltransferase family 87